MVQTFQMNGIAPAEFKNGVSVNFDGVNTFLFIREITNEGMAKEFELYGAVQDAEEKKWKVERITVYTQSTCVNLSVNVDAIVSGTFVKTARLDKDLKKVELQNITYDKQNDRFRVTSGGELSVNQKYRVPEEIQSFYFWHNNGFTLYFMQVLALDGGTRAQNIFFSKTTKAGGSSTNTPLILVWNDFNYQPVNDLIALPLSILPMDEKVKDNFTFVATEGRSDNWQKPGVAFYTFCEDIYTRDFWYCCRLQRQYVLHRPRFLIHDMAFTFTGKAYPAVQLFTIDKNKSQIHWLQQTDGVIGGDNSGMNVDGNQGNLPIFMPWHCLVTNTLNEQPTEYKAVAAVAIGSDDVMVFAVDKDARLWSLQRDLYHSQRWNATILSHEESVLYVKRLENDKFYLVTGLTPDGRPEVYFSGNIEGESVCIWRVSLNDNIWTSEKITNA